MTLDEVSNVIQYSNLRLERKIELMTALVRIDIRLRALRENDRPWMVNNAR
jgi:hypothetical protein